MRHLRTFGLLVAATAVAVPTLTCSGSSQPAKGAAEIQVLGLITEQHVVDNPPAGESAGDLVVFGETLFRSGRQVGRTTGTCIVITPPASFQCTAIAKLPKGQLMLASNVGEEPATGAITGGTGRYSEARGTFRVEPISEGRERITYRIRN